MMFRTGSVDEVSGKTGLAHMFEHMMFKGTRTLGTKSYRKEKPLLKEIDELHRSLDQERLRGSAANASKIKEWTERLKAVAAEESKWVSENELWNLYEREGASELNATTSHDFTQYIVDLPSNKLELWALLDSDRLKNPVFRQFYQEREVVKEERRMRVDTSPEGKLYENLIATAYMAHPYRNPTIGWESDLDHLSVADLQDFYERHYTPDRLTISVVGDVQAARVISMVDHYFGNWKAQPSVTPPTTVEPLQPGPRRATVRFDAQPHVMMAFHIPTAPDPDHIHGFAVSQLLGVGTSSRLYKTLVEKKKLALSVETAEDEPGERYPSLLAISVAPRYPHTTEEIERAVWLELERLKTQPIEAWELSKVRASVEMSVLSSLQTNAGMASILVYDQTVFGDWRYLTTFQQRVKEMTAADIRSFAQKYFQPEFVTVAALESLPDPTKKGSSRP